MINYIYIGCCIVTMEKIPCPKCGKDIAKNGYKVHTTFCKGKDGEPMTEEPKEIATRPKADAVVIDEIHDFPKKVSKVEEEEEFGEEVLRSMEEDDEESNPVLMICITVIVVAIMMGFVIFCRRTP